MLFRRNVSVCARSLRGLYFYRVPSRPDTSDGSMRPLAGNQGVPGDVGRDATPDADGELRTTGVGVMSGVADADAGSPVSAAGDNAEPGPAAVAGPAAASGEAGPDALASAATAEVIPDTDPADGSGRLAYEWADPHVNVISHSSQEPARSPSGALVCDRLYRHVSHTQVLLALDGPSVIAVAPADVAFDRAEDLDTVAAFLLRPLDALVLHRGTWHWGPFPLGDDPVHLFNVQGLRYREDNTSVDLATEPGLGAIEVRVR